MSDTADTLESLGDFAEALLAEEEDDHFFYDCPICGAPNDTHSSCGCYEDLHYGSN